MKDELILDWNGCGSTRSVIGRVTRVFEIVETKTYMVKERTIETDVLHGRELVPQKKTEKYIEIVTEREEIEINNQKDTNHE